MTGCLSVYITTPSREEADRIALALVEENLAACVNIMPGMHAIYRWQGKVEQASEVAILAKTTTDKFALLKKRVQAMHAYDVPCIIAWPIVRGNEDYLNWIRF